MKIKITTDPFSRMLERQIGVISEGISIKVNDETLNDCDVWFIYENMPQPKMEAVAGAVVFFAAECNAIKSYPKKFLKQFDLVVTCQRQIQGDSVTHQHSALPWLYGVNFSTKSFLSYGQIQSEARVEKINKISVVCSSKTITSLQKKRIEFIKKLKHVLGDQLDIFGRGFKEIDDKRDVILPYKYHLSLENSYDWNYWTEKIGDAYLGRCLPLYSGCPNIEDYFPRESFRKIDILNPRVAIEDIVKVLKNNEYDIAEPYIEIARKKLLTEHNFINIACEISKTIEIKTKSLKTVVHEKDFIPAYQSIANRFVRKLKSIHFHRQ